ncbi:DUF3142 domain-containing protein [Metakosakonia massiliensis]|uniref:DUF3142 domain-containing protein n=1 Tax=Phytobacter massiliensis TaxID=1485952 RepID=A0A6N2ZWI6_9ENTR
MGAKTRLLLVIAALLLPPASVAAVQPADHQAFWLWSGVKPTAEMKQAQTVYLHQGEVVALPAGATFEKLGLPASRLSFPGLWITVRFATLEVPDALLLRIVRLLDSWQRKGNRVIGLQIDFDAATHRLDEYGLFLKRVRAVLPAGYALGVTGLLDWAKTGDIAVINTLPIDELVIQSYQGRRTVSNYADYLPALAALRIPFKLGLVQHGEWREENQPASAWYRGTVVFMLNPVRGEACGSSRKGCR